MAYDERLANRLREILSERNRMTEKKMFGGICFMLRDHMLCGVGKLGFMFRIGVAQEAEALRRPGASIMAFNGRRFRGFVWVDPDRCDRRALRSWVRRAEYYIATLPAKKKTTNGSRPSVVRRLARAVRPRGSRFE